MPVLNDRVSVLPRYLMTVLCVPDTKEHSSEMTGVVEESPPKQYSERIERYQTLHASVGRKRVRVDLTDEGDAELGVGVRHADDADQSHDGTRRTERRKRTCAGNFVRVTREAGNDSGGQVRSKELLLAELSAGNWSEGPQDVHVDEEMEKAVVTEGGEKHWQSSRPRHRTRHEVVRHKRSEL